MQLWHEGAIRQEGGDGPYAAYPTLSPSGLAHGGKPNGRAATGEELERSRRPSYGAPCWRNRSAPTGSRSMPPTAICSTSSSGPKPNRRTDGYGGPDIRDRVRFPAEIVAAISAATGPAFPIGLRFSQWKEVNYDARVAETPQELELLLTALRAAGAGRVPRVGPALLDAGMAGFGPRDRRLDQVADRCAGDRGRQRRPRHRRDGELLRPGGEGDGRKRPARPDAPLRRAASSISSRSAAGTLGDQGWVNKDPRRAASATSATSRARTCWATWSWKAASRAEAHAGH